MSLKYAWLLIKEEKETPMQNQNPDLLVKFH